MGTEYFLVKPSKSEIFYLGKHLYGLEGISEWRYKQKAEYIEYECAKDLFEDIVCNTYYCEEYMTFGEVSKLALDIYEWCDEPVYLDSDISDNHEWEDYVETGSILNN